jgi:hypothetical protein
MHINGRGDVAHVYPQKLLGSPLANLLDIRGHTKRTALGSPREVWREWKRLGRYRPVTLAPHRLSPYGDCANLIEEIRLL